LESLYFWEFATKSPFVYLQSSSSVFFSARPRRLHRPCAKHRPSPRRPPRCHVPPQHPRRRSPPRAGPLPAAPRRAATARAATHPAGMPAHAPAWPSLLLDPEHVLEFPTNPLLHSHTHICTAFPLPELSTSPDLRRSFCSLSTAAAAASHPRSSAPRAPSRPTSTPQPSQFRSHAPKRPDHYAGELELPLPLGLAVVPPLRRLLAPAKHTTSTTSSRRSDLATSPPLSCPPATETPSTSFGAPPPASVHRRYVATVPHFLNTGHPHDRHELLNISPHLPLTAGELPRRNLISTDRVSCVARPRTQLQRFKIFQGPICRKSEPPYSNQPICKTYRKL
jgi:hypothetical protein